ncbi:Fic family protein [Bifidobacterium adolescentis]|uniref:Fic family protein n=1 Tax=Bifidobacterium adolescentis TaxID=1680 RepID=UPI0034A16B55
MENSQKRRFSNEVRWRSGLLPDLFGQVAHFVFHLAKDHSFADGNKRTAMSVSLALLDKEGINLDIDDDADPAENTLYKLISALVTEIITEETFASEFRNAGRVSGLRE